MAQQVASTTGTAASVRVYWDSVNGNDANPGTSASPKKTFNVAYDLFAKSPSTGPRQIIDANPTGSSGTLDRARYDMGKQGSASEPSALVGPRNPSGLGILTANVVDTDTLYGGPFVTRVSVSSPTLTAHAWEGASVRFLTGASAGLSFSIYDNDTTHFTFQTIVTCAHNDTFVVETPGTSLTFTNSGPIDQVVDGDFCANGIHFILGSANNVTFPGNTQMGFVRFDGGGQIHASFCFEGTFKGNSAFANVTGLPTLSLYDTFLANSSGGHASLWFRNGCCYDLSGGGVFSGSSLLVSGGQVAASRGTPAGAGGYAAGFPTFQFRTAYTGPAIQLSYEGSPPQMAGGLVAFQGGVDIKNTGTGDGISATAATLELEFDSSIAVGGHGINFHGGCRSFLAAVVGTQTGGSSFGIVTTRGDTVIVTDPNTGTTISGPGGAVKVGATTSTMAQIAAGTAAQCTDTAALCTVHS